MFKKCLLSLALIGLAVSVAQAQTSTNTSTQDGKVTNNRMDSYLMFMPYYLFADSDRSIKLPATGEQTDVDAGSGFMFGYGQQIKGNWFWEAQAFAGMIESGVGGATDFYQYGLGIDLAYRFARGSAVSPFVLAGLGGVYDDVVPDDDDSFNLFGNLGVGVISAPITDSGLRLRADARYIYSMFDNANSDGMGDIRLAVGLVVPLSQRVVEHTVVKTETVPVVDSDGDGVPDRNDDCPNTLPGALVDSHGCAQIDQNIQLEGVKFQFDKSTLTANAKVILRSVVKALEGQPGMRVKIAGHTDSIASNEYNQRLSERRARSVKQFLVGHGISPARLTTVGYGETRPIATNETAAGRQKNRRVVFHILKK